MRRIWCLLASIVSVVIVVVVVVRFAKSSKGGNNGNNSFTLPYLTPPVSAACPLALKSGVTIASNRFHIFTLDPTNVKDRFFSPGPTDLFNILSSIDSRIQGINDRASSFPCMSTGTPVAYQISTWGSSETFYAQCSEIDGSQGFDQWALLSINNNPLTFYLYERIGDGIVAATVTTNSNDGSQTVSAWMSVGIINRNGSHGVMQIFADPKNGVFEMSIAGAGMGYCGAQLKSNNVTMNVTGSNDMGMTCQATDSICTMASDLSVMANCPTSVDTFSLPSLGRQAYGGGQFGASAYPGGTANQVFLTTTGSDDTFFGPSSPSV